MSLSQIINQPCTLVLISQAEAGEPPEVETVCSLQQISREEPEAGGETFETKWDIFFLPGIEFTAQDMVIVDNQTFEFTGGAWHVENPWDGQESHVEATAVLGWPAVNARLLELNAPAARDDFGDVDEAGPAVWSGELEAVLTRERKTVISGGENTPVELDVLVLRKPPAVIATATPGDQGTGMTVLVEDRRTDTPVQSRFRLSAVEHRGRGEAETVRFELADERTP